MLKVFVFKYRIINYFPLVLSFLFVFIYRIVFLSSCLIYHVIFIYRIFIGLCFCFIISLFWGVKDHLLSPNFSPTVAQRAGPVSNNGSPTKADPIPEPSPHDSLFSFSFFGPTKSQPNLHGFFFHVVCPSETSSCLPQVHATLRPAIPSHVLLHSCYV